MIAESKIMFLGCALALIVGASLVSPLLMLNTVIDPFPENPPLYPNPQSAQSQIAVNIKNARLELGTITSKIELNSTETVTQPAFGGKISVSATKYLNNNESIPDAEVDYFLMQIFADNGTWIGNETVHIGTAYNRSFTPVQQHMIDGYLLDKTFGRYGGGVGTFFYTWSIGTTHENTLGFNGNMDQSTAALIANSQTLTIVLSRIGTITIKDNSTVTSAADAGLIETVTLTRNGNIFAYNS